MTIVTEEEAKTKWCPFARVPVGTETLEWVVGNRANQTGPGGLYKGSKCIASQCMAWRWAGERLDAASHERADWKRETVGYCGLAGTP